MDRHNPFRWVTASAVREKLHEPLGPKCGDVKFHHMAVEERRKQRAVKIIAAKARKFEKQQQKEAQAFLDRLPGKNGIPQPVPDTPEGLGMKDHTSERNGPGFS